MKFDSTSSGATLSLRSGTPSHSIQPIRNRFEMLLSRIHPIYKRFHLVAPKLVAAISLAVPAVTQAQNLAPQITQVAPTSSVIPGNGQVIVKWTGGASPFQVQSTPDIKS